VVARAIMRGSRSKASTEAAPKRSRISSTPTPRPQPSSRLLPLDRPRHAQKHGRFDMTLQCGTDRIVHQQEFESIQ
jgi:predicted ribosome quality control (RQC) complex YloA/Tae2 family protein